MLQQPPPTADLPTTCRCCGGRLDAQYQRLGLPHKPGYWLVTCWETGCPLQGYTRSASTYPTFDLAPYLEKEHVS